MATQLLLAKSPEEALDAKTTSAAYIAGGTEVNRLGSDIAEKAELLISLKKCGALKSISKDAGTVVIGSMCTFQQLIESEMIPAYLKEAAGFMASRTKRNMATIGGNIAAKRSDSYLIPALTSAGAVLEMICKDGSTERIGIAEYIEDSGAYGNALITSVTVPADIKLVSKRYSNTAQSHAVLTMSAALSDEGIRLNGVVKNVGLLHFCDLEKAFREDPDISEEKIIDMVRTCTGLETADDMFGSDAYKRYLIAVTAFDLHRQLTGKEV
ncbi:MAG: FAD binding domain-containing protein [Mogibacterium sp.]|nr:FAD binding domain-containing protein [Mogibacterium sp.]